MPLNLNFQPFSGVGIVTMHERSGSSLLGGFDLGEAPVFKITQSSPTVEMNTSRTQDRGVAFRMAQSKGASLEIQLKTLDDNVLRLLTTGTWTDVVAGSAVANWVAPSNLVVGQVIKLPHENVTVTSVVDSTGSPKTLPAGQYEVDTVAGTIALKDISTGGAYVQPFKVNYTPGAVAVLGALKASTKEYQVTLAGTNAYNGDRGVLNAYKLRFDAEGDSEWISESYGTWTLKGSLLQDTARSASSAGGQYYSWTRANA